MSKPKTPRKRGRPSKLSDREWAEIGRRLATGESQSALAREFKVSRPLIIARFSDRVSDIKEAGSALAQAELMVERLPIVDRVSARSLADQLKGVQSRLLNAADSGAETTEIMADLANRQARRLRKRADEEGTVEPEEMRPMVAMIEAGNRASSIGVQLLSAQKGKDPLDDVAALHTPDQLRRMAALQERK